MSMKRSPEWYAEYQRKQARFNNVELVELKHVGAGFVEPQPVDVLPERPRKLQSVSPDEPYPNLLVMFAERRIYPPVKEYPFAAPERKFRLDYAWPTQRVALEVDGGIWRKGGGAHSHPTNILRDIEKHNVAVMLGWRVIRATPDKFDECSNLIAMLLTGKAA